MKTPEAVQADPTRVFVLDDHRVFTESLALGLDMSPDMTCVAVAHSVQSGLRTVEQIDFDVALVDLQLPDGGGLGVIPELLVKRPSVSVIVLTAHPRADLARRAIDAGASGFFGKHVSLGEILDGIRSSLAGDAAVAPDLPQDPVARLGVTPREHEVLRALSRGLDANRIAASLGISLYTARDHIRSLLAKLEVRTQLDAVVTANRLGLVTVGAEF